ncbi:sigma-54 dependent transcriptional regulator [Henriciella sp. AS95]|uniref:sigma-54-dependent transcriptional regulator n=1 Tax=Henriciella sp. AS95 TaxID=3135782 RepID=UPI00316EC076
MTVKSKLLIVEDTPSLARTYETHLKGEFDSIEIADTGAKALASVQTESPSCILLDLKLPDADGLDLLDRWTRDNLAAPVIVITATGSMSIAVDAMRRGAHDFVVKPTSAERLKVTVKNALDTFQLKKVVATYEAEIDRSDFCGIVGRSLVMQGVYKTIEAAAPSSASVFVTGDTGTGKELVARAVHEMSPRRKGRFVAINCGAIPKDLIESEIFGHVKGAFTGATADRVGAAQLADGGTLFLDELGEMPIDLQPKLLRFLQLGEFSRVGEGTMRRADIRIIAATNRDPLQAIRDGRLREDLYYRLHVIPVALPSLAERGVDILLLAESFLERFGREENKAFTGFSRDAQEWLVSHPWPGNVRELENLVRQIAVMQEGGDVTAAMLPSRPAPAAASSLSATPGAHMSDLPPASPAPDYGCEPLWLTEKKSIERAITLCRGNIVAAAKRLEINPSTIYRKKAGWESSTVPDTSF